MHADERAVRVAGEWVRKADNDLKNAAHTLKLGHACPTDTVCFHAQQCVEKYLKALLVVSGRDFPKTHNVDGLMLSLPAAVRSSLAFLTADEQDRLTEYATVTRYPGDYDPIPLTEAREAVTLARRVRKAVRDRLPPMALRAPRRDA